MKELQGNVQRFWSSNSIRNSKCGIRSIASRKPAARSRWWVRKRGKTYPSKLGIRAKSDKAAEEVRADEFDVVVIPGGFALTSFAARRP